MPISKNVRIVTEIAGAEYPAQPAMIGTPYGRGRVSPLGDQLDGELEEEQAAQEHQQMPPAPERHRQHDRRQPDHRGPPARADRGDPVGDAGQPRRPGPREKPEHRRVDLIIEPQRRGPHRDHDHAGQDDNRQGQPGPGGGRDRVRQRRGRTGRASVPLRPPHGSTRRKVRVPARVVTVSAFSLNGTHLPTRPVPASSASSRPPGADPPRVAGPGRPGRAASW